MLRCRNLEGGYGKLKIIKGITLHVKPGEIVTIIGANGAGKTTLLNTLARLIDPSGGEIRFENTDITRERPEKTGPLRLLPGSGRETAFFSNDGL